MQNDREVRARSNELKCRTNTSFRTQDNPPISAQPSLAAHMAYSQNLEITERYSEQKKSNVLKKPAQDPGYAYVPSRDIELTVMSPRPVEVCRLTFTLEILSHAA